MESTRPATAQDAARCGELCREAVAGVEAARGGALWMRGAPGQLAEALLAPGGLDRLLADGARRVVVGTVDGAVVGLGVGRVEGRAETAWGVIEGCYVEPGARGVGVGSALVEDLVAWLAARGCRGVDASALPGDRTTKSLLEASGFKARLITLHRPLS